MCPLKVWPFDIPGTSFAKTLNLLLLRMLHAKYQCIPAIGSAR